MKESPVRTACLKHFEPKQGGLESNGNRHNVQHTLRKFYFLLGVHWLPQCAHG